MNPTTRPATSSPDRGLFFPTICAMYRRDREQSVIAPELTDSGPSQEAT
ncbi:hypothetical protein SAMN05421752_104259 [Natronorubrum thiooxidans]|uniref:Uncharacterized protein n=1 Tax=Natronorubrum thiooxidans TaxID=308853 RepID=A0A1N7EML1_9EURY|nr:hypothetical protein SAMN05421752_104259 [Natronorubrum thiooxidans]